LPEPDRAGQHEDVGGEHLLPDLRPLVAVALVGRHAEPDVVVDDAHHLTAYAVLLERAQHLRAEQRRAGVGRRRLERADEDEGAQVGHGAPVSVRAGGMLAR